MVVENTLLVLLFVLAVGLIIPEFFKGFKLPFLTLIILAGAVFGPNGLNYVQIDSTISFFGFLGMAFLMFMAGLETDITKLSQSKYKILIMAFLNSMIPFSVGFGITWLFGYAWTICLLIGIVFMSSSVAVIIFSLKNNKSINNSVAQLILSAVMVMDIVSLIALGLVFQTESRITSLPLPLYFFILISSVFLLFKIVPVISKQILQRRLSEDRGYERQLRFVIIMLVGVIVFFSFLGAHPILASFLAGLSLSGALVYDKTKILYSKLHIVGYGLFIPIFFFIIGMEMNLSLFTQFNIKNVLMVSLIAGLIISKFVSGYIAGRAVKLSKKDSAIFGSVSITQLTTTLAVTYAASAIGLFDSLLLTTIVLLSIITTLVGPVLASYISNIKES